MRPMQYGPHFISLKAHATLHELFFVKKSGGENASAKNGFASNSKPCLRNYHASDSVNQTVFPDGSRTAIRD